MIKVCQRGKTIFLTKLFYGYVRISGGSLISARMHLNALVAHTKLAEDKALLTALKECFMFSSGVIGKFTESF